MSRMAFIPSDVRRIVTRIGLTWTKLTNDDLSYYLDGHRDRFIRVLQAKYAFTEGQAESTLENIERLT